MTSIISLADARARKDQEAEDKTPRWEGPCMCHGCKHEWHGVGSVGMVEGLECPACGTTKGTTKQLIASPPECDTLHCENCGSFALTAFQRVFDESPNSLTIATYVQCIGCGSDLTEAFYST